MRNSALDLALFQTEDLTVCFTHTQKGKLADLKSEERFAFFAIA